MTFTIPEFWCGFMAGIVVMILLGLAAGSHLIRKQKASGGGK
mgnify:FL=1